MAELYSIDEEKLERVRRQKLWMNDPKYFKRVKISPSATIKMIMHGQQGVDRGNKQNGKPIEVMGLLLGRPDTEDLNCLVISDAQALPIEGFETRVIADDQNVINYMIELGESLEVSRKEIFCGWYHTHPFDLDTHGHCFLSNTDISTQLQWQRSEDSNGNPWLAIVIDPLYSLAKGVPEMMAFRVYPPEYSAPANETPEGATYHADKTKVELWGACWNRYYKLEIEYFMSPLSQNTLEVLKNKFLWQNAFTSRSALRTGRPGGLLQEVQQASARLQGADGGRGRGSGHGHGDAPSDRGTWDQDPATNVAGKSTGQLALLSSTLITSTAPSELQQLQQAPGGGGGAGAGESVSGRNPLSNKKQQQEARRVGEIAAQELSLLAVKREVFGPPPERQQQSPSKDSTSTS